MKKLKCIIGYGFCITTVIGIAFALWKIVLHWRAGIAEKAGHALDESISTAAKKLEKTASVLEEWVKSGQGENLGKELDEILTDTKTTLEKAAGLVERAISQKPLKR